MLSASLTGSPLLVGRSNAQRHSWNHEPQLVLEFLSGSPCTPHPGRMFDLLSNFSFEGHPRIIVIDSGSFWN